MEAAGAEQQTAASAASTASAGALRATATDAAQTTTLTSRPGTTMTFFTGAPAACFADLGARARRRLDRRAVGAGRHDELAAQLAVDLQHELDLVLRQRRGVDLAATARRGGRRASAAKPRSRHSAQVDVRHDRVEHAQQDRQAFAQRAPAPPAASAGTASSAFSIFMPADTTVLYWMRS